MNDKDVSQEERRELLPDELEHLPRDDAEYARQMEVARRIMKQYGRTLRKLADS